MVKVTGGGRGMKAISAHLRYISKRTAGWRSRTSARDDARQGHLRDLVDEWRFGGSLIPEDTELRPSARGLQHHVVDAARHDPLTVQWAAREFAKAELADHKYVMVLHDHQANPHVHISVRRSPGSVGGPTRARQILTAGARPLVAKLRERG